ncbi:MAG: leucine--tRNA ligase, partial [Clostridia bacterium]|nr:leucine--tRNA ligase [Clostridia bacterium]
MSYNFKEVEKKWQEKWYREGTFNAKEDYTMKKWYGLIEFPYPSGQGLHVGHPRSYTALDIIARKKRMEGYNVLYPIGFDAFGLPAENYAIKNHVHPKITTENNINHFREQLQALGFSFDWSREVNTTDPDYYKWTQWIFIQLYKKGLAYKATMPINFCTGCKVGLANEEVVNGVCERCGSPVVQKEKSQWMLGITKYAQRLIDDLDDIDFLDKIKAQQINWIGRSEGAEVKFKMIVEGKETANTDDYLQIYTTRPDTIFGATYMVIAPEHSLIEKYADQITNLDEVKAYKEKAALKSDFERAEMNKEKTGVEIKGIKAINPLTNETIPIWISDYVLITYGTGAIMAVPAHDDRDFEFATKFNLPIKQVIKPKDVNEVSDKLEEPYTDVENGVAINSGFLDGFNSKDAIQKAIEYIEENKLGTRKVNYKLRDWVFSRQRYWGEPIPMV